MHVRLVRRRGGDKASAGGGRPDVVHPGLRVEPDSRVVLSSRHLLPLVDQPVALPRGGGDRAWLGPIRPNGLENFLHLDLHHGGCSGRKILDILVENLKLQFVLLLNLDAVSLGPVLPQQLPLPRPGPHVLPRAIRVGRGLRGRSVGGLLEQQHIKGCVPLLLPFRAPDPHLLVLLEALLLQEDGELRLEAPLLLPDTGNESRATSPCWSRQVSMSTHALHERAALGFIFLLVPLLLQHPERLPLLGLILLGVP
mmetsp:Transcript_79593/g.212789  ORF Transcript_79593/g.212789 Transcript_79593/m.212789 type:complete len:254 (-) Transcript_79593:17-778(-)